MHNKGIKTPKIPNKKMKVLTNLNSQCLRQLRQFSLLITFVPFTFTFQKYINTFSNFNHFQNQYKNSFIVQIKYTGVGLNKNYNICILVNHV